MDIAKQYDDRVLVLSYYVDYWNRLGWKDQFGSAANTDRQRAYGKQFRLESVYTPQAVINGSMQFVGSNRPALMNVLRKPFS